MRMPTKDKIKSVIVNTFQVLGFIFLAIVVALIASKVIDSMIEQLNQRKLIPNPRER